MYSLFLRMRVLKQNVKSCGRQPITRIQGAKAVVVEEVVVQPLYAILAP